MRCEILLKIFNVNFSKREDLNSVYGWKWCNWKILQSKTLIENKILNDILFDLWDKSRISTYIKSGNVPIYNAIELRCSW